MKLVFGIEEVKVSIKNDGVNELQHCFNFTDKSRPLLNELKEKFPQNFLEPDYQTASIESTKEELQPSI